LVEASFPGFQAKLDRAIEQLHSLSHEVIEFGKQSHPYTIRSYENREAGHYLFRLYPAWEPSAALRWGVVVGEIVHDLRSGLDHLVRDLLVLAEQPHDRQHRFPIESQEPSPSFSEWATAAWRKRGHDYHGPLFGLDEASIGVIERCQPYHGGPSQTLAFLDEFWRIDKHRHLVPMLFLSRSPTVNLRDAQLVNRQPDRYEGGAYVVEVTVTTTGPDPHVDVSADAPFDIALTGPVPIVPELSNCAQFVLSAVLTPLWLPELPELPNL
jgi:hypothetical protein